MTCKKVSVATQHSTHTHYISNAPTFPHCAMLCSNTFYGDSALDLHSWVCASRNSNICGGEEWQSNIVFVQCGCACCCLSVHSPSTPSPTLWHTCVWCSVKTFKYHQISQLVDCWGVGIQEGSGLITTNNSFNWFLHYVLELVFDATADTHKYCTHTTTHKKAKQVTIIKKYLSIVGNHSFENNCLPHPNLPLNCHHKISPTHTKESQESQIQPVLDKQNVHMHTNENAAAQVSHVQSQKYDSCDFVD